MSAVPYKAITSQTYGSISGRTISAQLECMFQFGFRVNKETASELTKLFYLCASQVSLSGSFQLERIVCVDCFFSFNLFCFRETKTKAC